MSCSLCSKVVDPGGADGVDYVLLSAATAIAGRDGRLYPLDRSLIMPPYQPRRGWQAVFRINGQTNTVTGSCPSDVYQSARKLFDMNGIQCSVLNLWVNLNIQWIERLPVRHRNVSLESVLALVTASDAPVEIGIHELPKSSPSVWGWKIWVTLELYVTQTVYSYNEFLAAVTVARDMLNPTLNPLTGEASAYIGFNTKTEELRKIPLYTQEAAQTWLSGTKDFLGLKIGGKPD